MGKESGKSESIITTPAADLKAKSLLHALSEIEQISASEVRTPLPEGVVPMVPRFSFLDIGVKYALMAAAATFLLGPFNMAALEYLIPIFGHREAAWFDKIFVYCYACAPAVGIALLIGLTSAKVYRGHITKSLINNLLYGYAITKIVVSFFFVFFTYLVYKRFLTPDTMAQIGYWIGLGLKPLKIPIEKVVEFSIEFREMLTKSANFGALIHIGTAVLLLLSHWVGVRKTKAIEELRQEWE